MNCATVWVLESGTRPQAARHHPFRSTGSVLLILLAALLSLLSVVAVWANSVVRDTDRYVATVGPLASHPEVQRAVARRVTDQVLAQIDVDTLVKQLQDTVAEKGVPPKAAQLVGNLRAPITSGLKQLVSGTVERVVTSTAFETVWVEGNRRAHSAVEKALTGRADGAASLQNNQVAIDVAPIVARVKERLVKGWPRRGSEDPGCPHELRGVRVQGHRQDQDIHEGAPDHGQLAALIALLVAAAGSTPRSTVGTR